MADDRSRSGTPWSSKDGDAAPTPGAAGHPEPGSGHDDTKTETVAEGPLVRKVDGVPGADGAARTAGGVLTQAEEEGRAANA